MTRAVRLRHRVDGPPGGPALVLGPSLGTALEMWNPQVPGLSDRWRVVRFDLRGHGRSPAPPGPYTVDALALDVVALLDELGLDRVAYCGLSIGGAIGQWLAVHRPDRLDSLVLCCTAARFGAAEDWWERAARVRVQGTEWLQPAATERWFTAGFPASAPAQVQPLLRMLRTTSAEGYAACCDALADFDLRDRLGEIRVPTRVIAGADDPATPVSLGAELAEGIPGADLVVVPDAAHLANVEQPSAVTAAIREHLEGAS